ncbi:hypothetical protein DFH09DRAFT_1490610 [Mycena vulgaris]|nr:hypothetical protein DFH09DRAFT_1490610 [Mycena vulgaris]
MPTNSYATTVRRDSASRSPPPTAQAWGPPKHPLPPHRLARLANALGVSTPMPAIHTPSPLLSPSYNGSSTNLDQYRRSPTPSTSGFSPSSSKYLLHVIPPLHLPHDDSFDSDLTPPPSTASGYHTQFRRGTLVPVHPTLQSQLGAIAKEYALPSTAGLVLYLVSQPSASSPGADLDDEPGPRLSDDIWRHLWSRVAKTELRDELAPPLLGLGISSMAGRSTPYLGSTSSAYPLPLLSTGSSPTYPFTPSPTTPSSTSGPPRKSSSSRGARSEPETPDTSDAASSRGASLDLPGLGSSALIPILAKVEFDVDRRRAAWYEPWLRSRRLNHAKRAESVGRKNSMAEGEAPLAFRLNGDGRQQTGSPVSFLSATAPRYLPLSDSPHSMGSGSSDEEADMDAGKDPLADVFGADADTWADIRGEGPPRPQNPHVVQLALSAAELGEQDDDGDEFDGREADEDDMRDVLALMHDGGRPQLGVAIPGGSGELHTRRGAPPPTPLVLPSSFPSSPAPALAPQPSDASPSPSPSSAYPEDPEHEDDPDAAPDSHDDDPTHTRLPYLSPSHSPSPSRPYAELAADADSDEDARPPSSRAYDPDRRGGGIFDDMDLGFSVEAGEEDVDMADDADPNDRRKSQVLMRRQLDEIEKNLAQFSPRRLKTDLDLEEEQQVSFASPHLSPLGSAGMNAHMNNTATYVRTNADVFPPTPRLPHHPDVHPEAEEDDEGSDDLSQQAAWPAVPFTSLPDRPSPVGERAPPQLAVNGVSAAMPRRFRSNTASSSRGSTASTESEMRRRDLAEQQATYPSMAQQAYPLTPPTSYPALTPSIGLKSSLNSPLIPLSPDPFGRHPSQPPPPPQGNGTNGNGNARQSVSYWDAPVVIPAPSEATVARKGSLASLAETKSSRFSSDSLHGADAQAQAQTQKQANRTTLMSVKSIKKLWRKSNKASVSSVNTSAPNGNGNGRAISTVPENMYSPLSPPAPQRPNRPSMEDMDLPDVDVPAPPRTPITGSFGAAQRPPLPVSRPSLDPSPRPSQDQALMPPPSPRPSQDQTRALMPSPRPSMEHARTQSQMSTHSQLSVPPPMLRSTNTAPIIAAKVGPPRKASVDGLLWDQESPYPTRATRAPSVSSSASRPNSRPPSAASMNPPQFAGSVTPPQLASSSAPPTPAPIESHRNSVRKSILKWKSATNGAAVPAPLTPSATGFRTRKTSLSGSPSGGSPLNLPPDIPPSPKIPEQFINSYVGSHPPAARPNSAAIARRRLSAKMASTSTDASSSRQHRTQGSMASSRHSHGSEGTHESSSLDTSGFEIVSPKVGGVLNFPYHELDHERPLVDGSRM